MTRFKFSDVDFSIAVKENFSVRGVLKALGVAPHGGSYKTFYLRIKNLNLDISHFTGQGHLKGKSIFRSPKLSLNDLLVRDSNRVLSIKHKQRILDEGLLENKCSKCGLEKEWQGELIVLHIDHINGDHFDHRIENLRMLCPNCHSQTETYCSKNKKYNSPKIRKSSFIPQEPKKCKTCNTILSDGRYKNCGNCYNINRKVLQSSIRKTKINWPTIEELELQLKTKSYLVLAKELGVSDNAIRKHIKKYKKDII